MSYISNLAARLKDAKAELVQLSTEQKNLILEEIAVAIEKNTEFILTENFKDLDRASRSGISGAMLDRLTLNKLRIDSMVKGIRKIIVLNDPIGDVISKKTLPNGLRIQRERTPIGCIGIIYEARPNVTVDAVALCIKSSNAVMLRGGKEAILTNQAIIRVIHSAIAACEVSEDMVLLVEDTTREVANEMMRLNGSLDVLIPRGGAGLIKTIIENSTVPVIETGVGNCHIYVDETADLDMACEIVYNAKTSRPGVCNACESLVVDEGVAKRFLPMVKARLDNKNVIMLGCEKTKAILGGGISLASEDDYATEFLDYVISVKVVANIDEAIEHITKYSTGHSEAIITTNSENSEKFTKSIDSAAVYVNASTRFTDGEEFGLGAEIGISTQKLHARGPMGLAELTSSKYIVYGDGQIR